MKAKFGREAEGEERGKALREVQPVENPELPVPIGTFWTLDATLLFPLSSKRKTDVLSFCSPA